MLSRLVLFLLVANVGSVANSQDWSGWGGVSQNNNVNGVIWDDVRGNSVPVSGGLLDLPAVSLEPDAFSFSPSSEVRAYVQSEFSGMLEEDRPDLANLFADPRVMNVLIKGQEAYGLAADDVADTMTAYLMEMQGVASGRLVDPDPAMAAGIRDQVVSFLAVKSGKRTPAEKDLQAASDTMLLRRGLIGVMYEFALKSGSAHEVSNLARQQGLEEFGIDLSQVEITKHGFVSTNR